MEDSGFGFGASAELLRKRKVQTNGYDDFKDGRGSCQEKSFQVLDLNQSVLETHTSGPKPTQLASRTVPGEQPRFEPYRRSVPGNSPHRHIASDWDIGKELK